IVGRSLRWEYTQLFGTRRISATSSAVRRQPSADSTRAKSIDGCDCWLVDMAYSMTVAHGIRGFGLRGFIALFVFVSSSMQDSSQHTTNSPYGPILNLEQGHSVADWGRLIFDVADV